MDGTLLDLHLGIRVLEEKEAVLRDFEDESLRFCLKPIKV